MLAFWEKTREAVLDILFPPLCLLCRTYLEPEDRDRHVCAACLVTIPIHQTLFCPICLNRLPEAKAFCHTQASYLLGAATLYTHPSVQALIWSLKYGKETVAARPLGYLLGAYLKGLPFPLTEYVLLPVPLHPARERSRGFNQSAFIAEVAAQTLNLPFLPSLVERIKPTAPQAELQDDILRKENMAQSFRVSTIEAVRGKSILIVDDVVTSGATFNELVRVLKAAGARKVLAVALARAR
jgi:ComF family protein